MSKSQRLNYETIIRVEKFEEAEKIKPKNIPLPKITGGKILESEKFVSGKILEPETCTIKKTEARASQKKFRSQKF